MARSMVRDLPESQTGQIKIDLSIEKLEQVSRDRRRRLIRRTVNSPTIGQILRTLRQTDAKNIRISGEGKYTIIDYTA